MIDISRFHHKHVRYTSRYLTFEGVAYKLQSENYYILVRVTKPIDPIHEHPPVPNAVGYSNLPPRKHWEKYGGWWIGDPENLEIIGNIDGFLA